MNGRARPVFLCFVAPSPPPPHCCPPPCFCFLPCGAGTGRVCGGRCGGGGGVFSFCFFPFDVFSIIALVTQQQPSFLFLSVDVVSQGSWLGGMEGPFTRRTETKTKKHTCGFSRPLLAPLSPSSLDKVGKRGRMLRHARLQRFERRQALRRGRAARVGRRRLRPQEAGEGAHKGGAAGAGLQVVDAGAGQGLLDVAVEFLRGRGGGKGG